MEATIFTGWIYDHLLPHAEKVKVAHPLMLRAIAAAKKKNDKIDAGKIADCLRCDFLPECHMASTEIRDRRRTLRYRNLLVKQMVQMKNRVSGLLMETGVSYNKQRLHKVGLLRRTDVDQRRGEREHTAAAEAQPREDLPHQKLDYALVSSLERDPLLEERLRRLRTVPGVGPITALTWALEIGDFTRFTSIKQAISYCGLCGDEKSSADKVMRMPISKQRNKHIQQVLVEAAKLAPRECHELAVIRDRELERGNPNRATLAVARKMVGVHARRGAQEAGLRACRGVQTHGGSLKTFPDKEKQNIRIHRCAGCQVLQFADWAKESKLREALSELFRDWQRTQTQSSVTALRSLRQQMDVRFCIGRNHQPRGTVALRGDPDQSQCALSERAQETSCFSLDRDWVENRVRQAGSPIGSTR